MAENNYPKIGRKAPAFTLENHNGEKTKLTDYAGKWLVLYFYPKDNTSGCTTEACDFTAGLPNFKKLDAAVVGVSPDSVKSHQNFIAKYKLKVDLLSDPDKKMLAKYGVWQEKSMYGRKYMGVVRTTVLIDPDGKVAHVWEKVKVKGHVDKVKAKLKELS